MRYGSPILLGMAMSLLFPTASLAATSAMNMKMTSMPDMMDTLEEKSGDAFDQAFLEMMIPHHQGAVMMARMSRPKMEHDELKTLAAQMVRDQQREIRTMKQWQRQWEYYKSPDRVRLHWRAMGMTMSGSTMTYSMMDMIKMMRSPQGSVDVSFIDMMIPHHQDAIDMATLALAKASHQEVRDLAREIIDSQKKEIEQMRQWRTQWQHEVSIRRSAAPSAAAASSVPCSVSTSISTTGGQATIRMRSGVRVHADSNGQSAIDSHCEKSVTVGD